MWSDGTPSLFFDAGFQVVSHPRLSPDGQWVAYVSDQTGEHRIYVQSFPEGGRVIPISTGPGTEPVWSRDGRELFYRNGRQMMTVAIESGSEFVSERPSLLLEGDFAEGSLGNAAYDVSITGDRFLMLTRPEAATPSQMRARSTERGTRPSTGTWRRKYEAHRESSMQQETRWQD